MLGGFGPDFALLGPGNDLYGDAAEFGPGGVGDDLIFGGGADLLLGQDGNDRFFGQIGPDRIYGGAGGDVMTGGSGPDSFVFFAGQGADRITDFTRDEDRLLLEGGVAETANAGLAVSRFAHVTGAGAVFDFGGGNTITLHDLSSTAGLANDLAFF